MVLGRTIDESSRVESATIDQDLSLREVTCMLASKDKVSSQLPPIILRHARRRAIIHKHKAVDAQ